MTDCIEKYLKRKQKCQSYQAGPSCGECPADRVLDLDNLYNPYRKVGGYCHSAVAVAAQAATGRGWADTFNTYLNFIDEIIVQIMIATDIFDLKIYNDVILRWKLQTFIRKL